METMIEQAEKKTGSLFKNRNFVFLLISTVFSAPGYYICLIAAEWMMLTISDNRFYFGLLFIAAAVPRLVFMLVGGIVADRSNKRTILFISDITRAMLILGVIIFILLDVVTVWHLIVMAGIFGIADAFSYPATSSLLPTILPNEKLQQGNSLIQVSGLLSPIFGAAIGGTLIAVSGFAGAFTFSFVMLLIASITILFVRLTVEKSTEKQSGWEDLKAGFRYIRANELIVTIVLFALMINFLFTGPIAMGLPIIVKDVFQGDSINLAMVESAMGIGSLIGVIVLVSFTIKRVGVTLIVGFIGLGITYMLVGLSTHLYVTAGLVFAMSFILQFINIPLVTTLQKTTEKKMLGRMMSFLMFASSGLVPISFLVTSLLITAGVSIQMIMMGSGLLLTMLALFSMRNKMILRLTNERSEA